VVQEEQMPSVEELQQLGLYDPTGPDSAGRVELIRYLLARGAMPEDIATAANLPALAVDLNLRPQRPLTLGQVVADVDMEWHSVRRLLTATGLPADPGQAITPEEAAAVRLLAETSGHLLGEAATLQLARVIGSAVGRVAETLVGAFRLQFELPRRDAGTRELEFVKETSDIAKTMLPAFMNALDAVLRRQIVAVGERMWSTDEERSAVTVVRTVGFVDLVGYTARAASASVRELTEVLIDFDERTTEIVSDGNGQIVKTLGDEAMFVTEDAADGCLIAAQLVEAFGQGKLPPVRVGLASGELVSVFGDLYGPDVNLAARLVRAAAPGTAVVSPTVRDDAGDAANFDDIPPLTLKGFESPVTAYLLRPRS
jgi:adenylate cyclase